MQKSLRIGRNYTQQIVKATFQLMSSSNVYLFVIQLLRLVQNYNFRVDKLWTECQFNPQEKLKKNP